MLLSIIIPTKNRYTTLFNVVDTILDFNKNDEIEIVIQDNSDDNSAALNFVKQREKHSNLKYFHESGVLSVIENSDKAVLNSSGEFVCFIGDDDGVMPNIVSVTHWMKKNNFKVLKAYKPSYYWPDQKSNYLSKDVSGVLTYKKWKPNSFNVIKTKQALDYTLAKGGVSMHKLPCLYHGIVERNTLNKIYSKTNTFFPGPSPDMANAIALTQVVDEFVYVHYPVVISGKSTKSTGGAGVLHQHISKIEDVPHLPKNTSDLWDDRIPKYWTGPTIWAESVLKSLESFGNTKAISKFNFNYLYASLVVFNQKHLNQIFKDFTYTKDLKYYKAVITIFLNRVKVFITNRIGSLIRENDMKTIQVAINKLSYIDSKD